jgi:hypothetical protein
MLVRKKVGAIINGSRVCRAFILEPQLIYPLVVKYGGSDSLFFIHEITVSGDGFHIRKHGRDGGQVGF